MAKKATSGSTYSDIEMVENSVCRAKEYTDRLYTKRLERGTQLYAPTRRRLEQVVFTSAETIKTVSKILGDDFDWEAPSIVQQGEQYTQQIVEQVTETVLTQLGGTLIDQITERMAGLLSGVVQQPVTPKPDEQLSDQPPVKRKRGRPRKNPLPVEDVVTKQPPEQDEKPGEQALYPDSSDTATEEIDPMDIDSIMAADARDAARRVAKDREEQSSKFRKENPRVFGTHTSKEVVCEYAEVLYKLSTNNDLPVAAQDLAQQMYRWFEVRILKQKGYPKMMNYSVDRIPRTLATVAACYGSMVRDKDFDRRSKEYDTWESVLQTDEKGSSYWLPYSDSLQEKKPSPKLANVRGATLWRILYDAGLSRIDEDKFEGAGVSEKEYIKAFKGYWNLADVQTVREIGGLLNMDAEQFNRQYVSRL